jgi:hypothetical protein
VGSYYYFVAQLPGLVYGQNAPMSSAAFRDLAKNLLRDEDFVLLDLVSLDPGEPDKSGGPAYEGSAAPTGCDFIDRWREWERALRLNLARTRAQRLRRENDAPVEPPVHPADAAAVALKAGATAESPLEAEIFLDKARWNAIEYLQGIDYFSRNTIYAYLLKLLILERYGAFKEEAGFAEYKSLYASILERVQSGELPVGEPK